MNGIQDSETNGAVKTPEEHGKLLCCFDGTGNQYSGDTSDTNVVKLFQKFDRNASRQFHYYQRKSCSIRSTLGHERDTGAHYIPEQPELAPTLQMTSPSTQEYGDDSNVGGPKPWTLHSAVASIIMSSLAIVSSCATTNRMTRFSSLAFPEAHSLLDSWLG